MPHGITQRYLPPGRGDIPEQPTAPPKYTGDWTESSYISQKLHAKLRAVKSFMTPNSERCSCCAATKPALNVIATDRARLLQYNVNYGELRAFNWPLKRHSVRMLAYIGLSV